MIIIYWFLYYYGLLCVAIIIIIIAKKNQTCVIGLMDNMKCIVITSLFLIHQLSILYPKT